MSTPNADVDTGLVPELRVPLWFDASGNPAAPVHLADIDTPLIYLFCFQSWCPGCHSHGFPSLLETMKYAESESALDRITFIIVQTVFEGHDQNTSERAVESLQRYDLVDSVVGHDSGNPPNTMFDYRTGGTPWSIVMGPRENPDVPLSRRILGAGFQLNQAGVNDVIASTSVTS